MVIMTEEWLGMEDVCFITGDIIPKNDRSRFTHEFDAWVSERGQQLLDNAQATGELEMNREWEIIYGEWYAEDEGRAGREAEWLNE
jgi:hypothetical protein